MFTEIVRDCQALSELQIDVLLNLTATPSSDPSGDHPLRTPMRTQLRNWCWPSPGVPDRTIFTPRENAVRGTVAVQGGLVAASAVLVAICLIATILILESGARMSLMGAIASGPVPYVVSLAAVALLVVSLLQRRSRALFRNPRSLLSLAVGVAVVIVVVVTVNAISPYQDCGPGGNLISIGSGGHGEESRNGIQSITEEQYRSYLACGGVHSWLQAFAAAGVALTAQIVGLVTRS